MSFLRKLASIIHFGPDPSPNAAYLREMEAESQPGPGALELQRKTREAEEATREEERLP